MAQRGTTAAQPQLVLLDDRSVLAVSGPVRRSFLVAGFKLTEATSVGAKKDDLTIIIDGRVFLSQPTTATTTPVVAPATTTGE